MNYREKILASSLMVAVLLSNVAVISGLPAANAQIAGNATVVEDVTISTSADGHGQRFFGQGALQVIVTDRDANDNGDDVIIVRLSAQGPGSSGDSGTFTIPNTNPGSQKFEFYLVHAASQYADGVASDGTELDTINNDGFDSLVDGFDGVGAPIIRFGSDAGSGVELATGSALYQDLRIDIQYDDKEARALYEETRGELGTDRDVYGTDNIVYLIIHDQDANLNPTEPDSFNITDVQLDILFELSGASFADGVTFEETGDNTAMFEGKFSLAASDSASDDPPELVLASSSGGSVSATLNDMANYADMSASENDSNDTFDVSFSVDNRDGVFDEVPALTFGGELKLVMRDDDQNKDSQDDETLEDVVTVKVGTGDADGDGLFDSGESDQELIDMEETDDNSGVFVIDGSNGELKITFLQDGVNPTPNNGMLELRKIDMDLDISVSYRDPLDDNSASSVTSSFAKKMQLAAGTASVPASAGINDDFAFSITDRDLNDNPRTRDSYSFTLTGSSGTYALKRGGISIAEMATIEVEIAGNVPTFASPLTYTLIETAIDSGVFAATLDMRKILASAGIDADDGDRFRITYNDLMAKTARESAATLIIQRSSTALDFSRAVLPIPPEDDLSDPSPESSVGSLVGTRVVTTLVVTDVRENTQPSSENLIEFRFRNDPGLPRPAFAIEVEGNGIRETIDTEAKYNGTDGAGQLGDTGAFLADILPELPTLKETGKSTGMFEEDLVFVNTGILDTGEWHNLKVVFTYYNDLNDDERAGITFRGNEGAVTTDTSSVMSGNNLTITVQDEDLNLDDSQIEEFRTSLDTNGIFILAIEPEDDDIETKSVRTKTFRETGPDTGIFTASFVVGRDIPVTEDEDGSDRVKINQATVIEVTYNDEIDSTGGSGDELELAIPVVTSTGSIQVMPENKVGPGTKITVLIVDNDLNMNPKGTDKFEGDNDGDGIVVFRTDRRDAGKASPDLKETGPGTGVFQFELQLVPIQGGDDGEPIGVEGGSEPRIGAIPGDLIAIQYEDENDGQGRTVPVSRLIQVTSWDPQFFQDKESYDENDRVILTIVDPDANRNPDIADSIRDIRVYSQSDRVGRTYSALETDKDSGMFKLAFMLTTRSQSGAVTAYNGEEVTVLYEDEFPADYVERIKRTDNADKKFLYTIAVGVRSTGIGSTLPSTPTLKDITGNEVVEPAVGRQLVLSTTIQNNNARPQPFVAIIEVRNSLGVSESIEWQTGSLNPDGESEIGISWTPEKPGTYQLRTFVISNFESPEVLSPVAASEVSVAG